jgi:hypothetical protein
MVKLIIFYNRYFMASMKENSKCSTIKVVFLILKAYKKKKVEVKINVCK